jgi:hypothetical protein
MFVKQAFTPMGILRRPMQVHYKVELNLISQIRSCSQKRSEKDQNPSRLVFGVASLPLGHAG